MWLFVGVLVGFSCSWFWKWPSKCFRFFSSKRGKFPLLHLRTQLQPYGFQLCATELAEKLLQSDYLARLFVTFLKSAPDNFARVCPDRPVALKELSLSSLEIAQAKVHLSENILWQEADLGNEIAARTNRRSYGVVVTLNQLVWL